MIYGFPMDCCENCKHSTQEYPSTSIFCTNYWSKYVNRDVQRTFRCDVYERKEDE